ncbi:MULTISPECIES: HEPN domain-containing protein [Prochlorococcus]|uniref:HEPN domain-containing protein n=1 Tax=Prochlorococcus TaxID=1218 RepID=UPI000533A052|nr:MULTISPECIES: HEPN domain-containing protein [Prochlorococcus]KGG12533.1 hypothetical protein EV05_1745 [Prochlorococcus sp. MIT 0601]
MKIVHLVISGLFAIMLWWQYPVLASEEIEFKTYMNSWNENIEKASRYLKEAEAEFKRGDELQGCVKQRQAAKYGIKGTESLIKAFEISESTSDLSNIQSGLDKWKELRDFC